MTARRTLADHLRWAAVKTAWAAAAGFILAAAERRPEVWM